MSEPADERGNELVVESVMTFERGLIRAGIRLPAGGSLLVMGEKT